MTAAEPKSYTKPTKDTHISPSRASYGMSVVRILEKIDQVMTALHCTTFKVNNSNGTALYNF